MQQRRDYAGCRVVKVLNLRRSWDVVVEAPETDGSRRVLILAPADEEAMNPEKPGERQGLQCGENLE